MQTISFDKSHLASRMFEIIYHLYAVLILYRDFHLDYTLYQEPRYLPIRLRGLPAPYPF